MILLRTLRWLLLTVFLAIVAGTIYVGIYGWNWLREPVERISKEKTGRELTIGGELHINLGWPRVIVRAGKVRFANPSWASHEHMLTADSVDFSLNLSGVFQRQMAMDILTLRHAEVHLETAPDGRKNWLLDAGQKDEQSRLMIGRLALEQSRIVYDDPAGKTHIEAEVSTRGAPIQGNAASDVAVSAKGRYRGLPFSARGTGGPLLALRDEGSPYPFAIEATIDRTRARADGTVTDLSELRALDAEVSVRGDSLAELFPLIGIVLPKTAAYRTNGRVTHHEGTWRYADFFAHVGDSDMSGTLQVDTAGRPRPYLHGEVTIGKLQFADLGPVIGSPNGAAAENRERVLPAIAFQADRWNSVDADVVVAAQTIVRTPELPIDRLNTRLRLRDSVLTLDPLTFGVAGGTLAGTIALDGQKKPIHARAKLDARKIVLARLMPALKSGPANPGAVTGGLELTGRGNTVAEMLGTSDGSVGLLVDGGEMSRLMMETAGLHVLEMIALKIGGDQPIRIRCGMAALQAREGVMRVEQLVFDTEISHVTGGGSVDFSQERLDLTLTPKSKETNLISLRSPILVRGTFANPQVDVDRARLAVRGLGALALGVANPLLALAPLVEAGPGPDSDCGRLLEQARAAGKPRKGP